MIKSLKTTPNIITIITECLSPYTLIKKLLIAKIKNKKCKNVSV